MAIKTGIGVGGAQIFDTSGIMNAYNNQVAQRQKAQALQAEKEAKASQRFDEDLATAMAGIKTNGVDQKTAEYIQNEYLKVKGLRSEAEKLNPSQRPLFLQGIKDKMDGLRDFALNAKDHGSKLFTLGSKLNPYDYDESTLGRYKKLSETPYYQLTPEEKALNPTMFPKRAKFELIDGIINETYKLAEEKADFKGEIRKGGKRANYKEVDPKIVDEILNQKFGYNPEAQAALQQLYINTTGDKQPTPEKVSKFRNDVYLKQHPLRYTGEYRDLKEPKGGGGTSGLGLNPSDLEPIELNIPFAEGKGVVNVKDYVKLPMEKQNFAGSGYIDMNTGRPSNEQLQSSNDYEVVGVGNFPIIKKGSNLSGSLAQPNYVNKNPNSVELKPMVHVQKLTDGIKQDLLIPYDRLPSSKKVNKALANFRPTTSGSSGASKPATQDNAKVLQGTKSQLKDAASKKGLSIDEYKKQLKLAGYTVIEK